jgi:hypothetical protein
MMIPLFGTPEHAASVTEGRHPGIRDGLQWLTFSHLPVSLQQYSAPFYNAAVEMLEGNPADSPELTTALNKLIEAKDSAVRAGIRNDTGRAGSIPRPQAVTHPPALDPPGISGTSRIGTNAGHGHAWERPDGMKAWCGGTVLCAECRADAELVRTA